MAHLLIIFKSKSVQGVKATATFEVRTHTDKICAYLYTEN